MNYQIDSYSSQNSSYATQMSLYEDVVKYARSTSQGEYMNGGKMPTLNLEGLSLK